MMTTISFEEPINFGRSHFRNLEDSQMYLIQSLQSSELSPAHKSILDDRLEELESNPDNSITLNELKTSIKRK